MVVAARTFVDVLNDLNEGGTVAELTEALTKLMGDIQQAGKGGSLVLTLDFKPTGKGSQIEIKDSIRAKPPKSASGTTVLFVNDDHVLVRKDPRQPELTGLRRPADVTKITRSQEAQ